MTNPTIDTHRIVPTRLDRPRLLSALWIYVLLNMLFRDIHEIFRRGFLEEVIGGAISASDIEMVVAAIMLQLPLALIVFSPILPRQPARIAHIVVAVLVGITVGAGWPKDADDTVFTVFETVALAAIILLAATTKRTEPTA